MSDEKPITHEHVEQVLGQTKTFVEQLPKSWERDRALEHVRITEDYAHQTIEKADAAAVRKAEFDR